MRYSKFSRIYEISSKNNFFYLLRNTITNDSYFLNEDEFVRLNNNINTNKSSPSIKTLIKSHVVVPKNYSENKFLNYINKKYSLNRPEINIFYLTFNNECNLACDYCYVEGSYDNDKLSQVMKNSVYKNTISFIKNYLEQSKYLHNYSKKISFIYYGSEPLLNKKMVISSSKEISQICKKLKIDFEIHIITNGTLIDNEYIKNFKKLNIELAISLDGEKNINDLMRTFKGKKNSTYNRITKAIKKLNIENIPFGISCTIGPHNVEFLEENINLFKKLQAGGVGFNILLNAKNKKIPYLSINRANDALILASDYANHQSLYEDRIQRKLKAFNMTSPPHFKDCGAVGNQLVFYPDGDIGVCQAYLGCKKRPLVGNVKKDKDQPLNVLKNEVMKKWATRHPINMKECHYCPALGICGGGCVFNAEILFGNTNVRDKSFCVHTHKILDWLLIKLVKQELQTNDIFLKDISFIYTYC